jgi:hypothetical protein|tara:strand:- start:238 stop:402 length:165 start_codon:yes stop_codon:yes gene_type:complete
MSKVRKLDNLHAGISDLSEPPKKKNYCFGETRIVGTFLCTILAHSATKNRRKKE